VSWLTREIFFNVVFGDVKYSTTGGIMSAMV